MTLTNRIKEIRERLANTEDTEVNVMGIKWKIDIAIMQKHSRSDLKLLIDIVEKQREALEWMSNHRALTIFCEEIEHVEAFFAKCDEALAACDAMARGK